MITALVPEQKNCIICLMKLTSEFSTHDCGCQYHNICINVWKIYKNNAKCPNCRKVLLRERETPIGICIACLKNKGCKSMNKNCSHFYCEECFEEVLKYYYGFCPICMEEYNGER
ncbi:uncharacterized protein LOC126899963 [Daktulosphaira vitifoliae]|uniref:uncharacterized protein LOC126899963 n=1 Tax=Daktulosphaira vitifoliae TaxID=58002 RepID=UPI0021AAA7C8|nr:uncharacterized protein LOC126899963 [Daktulosphaira vitifoliae]